MNAAHDVRRRRQFAHRRDRQVFAGNPDADKRDEALLMKARSFKKEIGKTHGHLSTLELSRQLTATEARRNSGSLVPVADEKCRLSDQDFSFLSTAIPRTNSSVALLQRGMAYQSLKNHTAAEGYQQYQGFSKALNASLRSSRSAHRSQQETIARWPSLQTCSRSFGNRARAQALLVG